MALKEQGEFLQEVKDTLDEWEEKVKDWYISKVPDMIGFLDDLQERVEEFAQKIKDRFPEEGE